MLSLNRLPNALPGEKVVKVLRRDFFIFFKRILFFILLAALPLGFFLAMASVYPILLDGPVSYPLIILAGSGYYLFIWLFFFFSFLDYYLDIWIITSVRIIDVSQEGFFSRKVNELTLNRVQDIESDIQGLWATIFKFGDVKVQTAAEIEDFEFQQVADPEGVKNIIMGLASKAREGQV